MSFGPSQKFECGIASGASTSSFIDLGDRPFRKLSVFAVTMSTNAMVTVYGGDGTTFRVVHERVNTAPVQYQALTIATSTSGGWATLDAPPFRYVRFHTSDVVSGGASFTVYGQV